MNQNLSKIGIQKYELIATFIGKLASCYGRKLTDDDVEIYAEVLMGMELTDLRQAMEIYTSDSKNRGFPSPFALKASLIPEPRELAIDAVGRIVKALRTFPGDHTDRARQFIGELGWQYVVDEGGGWWNMKGASFDMGEQAQARDWIMTQIKFKRLGIQNRAHSFDKCLLPVGEMLRAEKEHLPGEKISLCDSMSKAKNKEADERWSDVPQEFKGLWKKLTPAPPPVHEPERKGIPFGEIDHARIAERQKFLAEQGRQIKEEEEKRKLNAANPNGNQTQNPTEAAKNQF